MTDDLWMPMDTSGLSNEPGAGFARLTLDKSMLVTGNGTVNISGFSGRLIALEGTDGVGRSTQIALLREFLETQGFGVMHTGLTRGRLAGDGLRKAKLGTTLGQRTLDLFYATDFADRLENDIIPALRAGFVVLTDRYVYSVIARAMVRGMDRRWLTDLYGFAPEPHGVLYMRIDLPQLIPRVLSRGGFDYWESGMDFLAKKDLFSSFVPYQARLLATFDEIAELYKFQTVDATRGVAEVFRDLRDRVMAIVSDMK